MSSGWTLYATSAEDASRTCANFMAHLRRCSRRDSNFSAINSIYGKLLVIVLYYTRAPVDVFFAWKGPAAVLRVRGFGDSSVPEAGLAAERKELFAGLDVIRQLAGDVQIEFGSRTCDVRVMLPIRRRLQLL